MKYLIFIILLLGNGSLFSQAPENTTRAVVIGISDYQDEDIPDLKYAHRDAEAFASFLISPAGGSLQSEQLSVFTNNQATTGRITAALGGLIESSKSGDRAIIYFSGHGDVERITKYQRGYWLTFDTPYNVYSAGGFSLAFLQDIITTLSEEGVEVIIISDACRAGKLAGSSSGGSGATTAALAQQYANEIKILSCQPSEFSLEGDEWGGGHGCFSYHLIDALYGFADTNTDGKVDLFEMGRYLEDKVSTEVAPHRQMPLTLGNRSARLAFVQDGELLSRKQQKIDSEVALNKLEAKGFEEQYLLIADSSIQILYKKFIACLEKGQLMSFDSSETKTADYYFKLLINEPSIAPLHGLMTRNFAAELMDEGQVAMNRLLSTDQVLIQEAFSYTLADLQIAEKLSRAANLLGEEHFIYNTLKSKEYYFRGQAAKERYMIDNENEFNQVKSFALKALNYDNDAAYVYTLLAEIYKKDSLRFVARRIDELTPGWAYGHSVSAFYLAIDQQNRLSLEYTKKAIAADSSYLIPYWRGLNTFLAINEYDSTRLWRTRLGEKVLKKVTEGIEEVYAIECLHAGISLSILRRFEEADILFQKGSKMAEGKFFETSFFYVIITNYLEMGKFNEAISLLNSDKWSKIAQSDNGFRILLFIYDYFLPDRQKSEDCFQKLIQQQTLDYYSALYLSTGLLRNKSYMKADSLLTKALKNYVNNPTLSFYLAESKYLRGNDQIVEQDWLQVLDLTTPEFYKNEYLMPNYLLHLIALHRLGQTDEWNACLQKGNETLNQDPWFHHYIACFYSMTEQPKKAMEHLIKAEELGWEPNTITHIFGTAINPMLDPLLNLAEFNMWKKRWFPPYPDKK